jgi:hypothetical protein
MTHSDRQQLKSGLSKPKAYSELEVYLLVNYLAEEKEISDNQRRVWVDEIRRGFWPFVLDALLIKMAAK